MAETQGTLEVQLKSLTRQVQFLQETVDELSARLSGLEKGKVVWKKEKCLERHPWRSKGQYLLCNR